jgi:hypothetical protein
VPGLYSLVRRRWQVLSSSKTAQEQLNEAEALVLQSRQKATRAKSRLDVTIGPCIACWVLWGIVPTIALHSLQLVRETV